MCDETDREAGPRRVRVIGCGAIAREILAVCEAGGLSHIDLICLPAIWHNRPEKIAPGVRAAIGEARREGFERIFVAYAECGTQGELDKVCREEGIERVAGPHCFSFYSGNELKELYFGNYRKLVYLAQTEDAELQRRAREAADFLGLDYEYRLTGYGDLTPALRSA